MKSISALSALFPALLAWTTTAMAQSNHFEMMDVFQLEFASDPQISPDGKHIVYERNSMNIMEDRRRTGLWIVDADGSNHRKLTSSSVSESSPRWSPDGSMLAYLSREEGKSQIFLCWMDTGQTAVLTQVLDSPRQITWSPDGKHIAFSALVPEPEPTLAKLPAKPKGAKWADPPKLIERVRNRADGRGYLPHGFNHLFVVPDSGGTARQVTTGEFHHRSAPSWTPDSKMLVFSANRNEDWEHEFRNSEIYSVSLESGEIRALTDRNGPDQSPVVSPDGNTIAYLGYDDKIRTYQVSELYIMNIDGTGKRRLTESLDRSVSNPAWSSDGRGLFFQYDSEGNTKLAHVTLDGEVRVLVHDLGGTSYGRPYGGGSFSVADNGTFAFTLTRPERPGDVALGTLSGSSIEHLTALNDDLLAYKTLGAVEEIWFDSSFDGRKIQGWIVKPPDFDPQKKYPLILEIHGGPIANYGDRFSAEIQLYATAGYVVLYTNPRGSTSYGGAFGDLLYHNYPGEDYDGAALTEHLRSHTTLAVSRCSRDKIAASLSGLRRTASPHSETGPTRVRAGASGPAELP